MATIRLIPSTYYLSDSTYLSVSDLNNMYANTDSTNYATVTNSKIDTNSYYIYLRGFNFDDIPPNAVVNSFTVKLKAYENGINTSSSYSPKLCHGTSQITSTCSAITTTASVYEFTAVEENWENIVSYGSDFGIRINCKRAKTNATGYMYIYGAEIEVTYTVPNPRTITSTLSGDGTISPSGANTYYDDDEYELTITPTNKSDTVTVTQDGVDVTSQLVPHYSSSGEQYSVNTVLGTYSLISGGFSGSGSSYFSGLVGKGHTATQTTSNYYSSGSGTQAVFQYAITFSDIPSNAIITNLYMIANGHAESTSNANEYMCVQLKSGSTELSEKYNFKSHGASNGNETIEATTLPTVAQLNDLVVEMTLGYYGGAINGVTVYLEYETSSGLIDYYTYTYTVSGNSTINVKIGSNKIYIKVKGVWEEASELFIKSNGSWVTILDAYKKVNGSWVKQPDKSALFDENVKFIYFDPVNGHDYVDLGLPSGTLWAN